MVRIPIGIFAVFCLVSLLVSSCGSSNDTDISASPDPDKILVTDTLPDQATTMETEFLRAAHILITWYIPVEDRVSDSEEDAPEPIDIVLGDEEDAPEPIDIVLGDEEDAPEPIDIVLGDEEDAPEPIDIVLGDEEDALQLIRVIQDEILSGQATFEEMAFNYSHCTSAVDSGRLPDFTSGAITEELDSTIFALEPGEISGIIRTRFGYHLVKRLDS